MHLRFSFKGLITGELLYKSIRKLPSRDLHMPSALPFSAYDSYKIWYALWWSFVTNSNKLPFKIWTNHIHNKFWWCKYKSRLKLGEPSPTAYFRLNGSAQLLVLRGKEFNKFSVKERSSDLTHDSTKFRAASLPQLCKKSENEIQKKIKTTVRWLSSCWIYMPDGHCRNIIIPVKVSEIYVRLNMSTTAITRSCVQ